MQTIAILSREFPQTMEPKREEATSETKSTLLRENIENHNSSVCIKHIRNRIFSLSFISLVKYQEIPNNRT